MISDKIIEFDLVVSASKAANFAANVVLPLPEEFSKLSELDSKIGIITGTNNIVGSLAVSSENIITQYLKENC